MEDFWEDDPAEDPFVSNKGKARYSNRNISADKIIDVLDMSGIKRPGDLGISRDEWLAQVSKKLTEMHGGGGIPDYTTMPAYGLKRAKKGKNKFFVPKGEKLPWGVAAIKEADEDENADPVGKSYANQPIVYVDMDGVLVDFFGEWATMHGVENWRDIAPLLKKQGKTIDDALDDIRARDDFWINLKPHTGAKALLASIKKHAGEYIILSSPLSNDPNSEPQKRAWVKNNLSAFPPKEVIIHKRKQDYATQADGTPNILIDDFSEQVKPWKAAGGIALKHSNSNTEKTINALKQQFETTVTEAYKTRIKIGDVLHRADHAVNAAKQLNAKVVRTASGYYKVAPLDDPRPAVTVNTDYYDQQRKLNKEIRELRYQTDEIKDKFNSKRRKVFDEYKSLFSNHKHGGDKEESEWIHKELNKLHEKYFGRDLSGIRTTSKLTSSATKFLQLTAEIRAKEQELKQLVDSNKRSVPEAWKVKMPGKNKRKMSKQDKDWSMLRTALESELFEAGAGDCFEIANRAMIHMTEEQETYGMKCVHAYVYGQGELKGRRFPHAWNEQGDVVLDNSNGNNIVMRKEQYYALGGVVQESGAYVTYDKDDCLIKMLKHSHYGPWDLNDSLDEGIPDEVKEIGKENIRISKDDLEKAKDELSLDENVNIEWKRFKADVA